ncbi:MAG TPA: DUF3530 family protein [Spongiibacteraceae bacterium]|nr:DUF3530 family protein [Spongiibacteraceae bacterium]
MTIIVRLIFSLALSCCTLLNQAWAQATTPASSQQTPPTSPTPAAAPNATPAPATGIEGERIALFSDRIPSDQIVTLDAGGDKFQGWHIADLTGQPLGAVIILPDSGHVPSWPFTAAALVDDLPLHGWSVLSIELPAPAPAQPEPEAQTSAGKSAPTSALAPTTNAAPSAATNPATPAPAPAAASSTPLAIEPQTQARISAAIKYFAEQNQRNIVLIGFGSGAIRAAETLKDIAATNTATPADTTPITALVMIAPQQQIEGIELDLPKLLPLTGIPTLDMVLDSDQQTRTDTEARRRGVLHQRTRIYTRLELPPINSASDAQHSGMVKRVRAWLQKNAYPKPKPAEKKTQTPPVPQQ